MRKTHVILQDEAAYGLFGKELAVRFCRSGYCPWHVSIDHVDVGLY